MFWICFIYPGCCCWCILLIPCVEHHLYRKQILHIVYQFHVSLFHAVTPRMLQEFTVHTTENYTTSATLYNTQRQSVQSERGLPAFACVNHNSWAHKGEIQRCLIYRRCSIHKLESLRKGFMENWGVGQIRRNYAKVTRVRNCFSTTFISPSSLSNKHKHQGAKESKRSSQLFNIDVLLCHFLSFLATLNEIVSVWRMKNYIVRYSL